jgi:FAD synthetase
MSLRMLVSKYINSAEKASSRMTISNRSVRVDVDKIREIAEWAEAYLEDAKYYREKEKLEVSLTSVAYCEGMLDALRLSGMVKFEWPTKERKPRKAK